MRESGLLPQDELARRGIIYPEMPGYQVVEAFREIRTKINQKVKGRNCVLMVTSPANDGGSASVALNLAAAFAFDAGQTALAMDCDFRRPSFQRFFDVGERAGLTDYLGAEKVELSEIIHAVGLPRVRVTPAGLNRNMSTEYFTTPKMRQLVEGVKRRYRDRFIILNAPPTTETANVHILSDLCDFVVLVVPYGKVTGTQLEVALRAIDRNKVAGIVLHDVPTLPPIRLGDWVPGFLARSVAKLRERFAGRIDANRNA
jgi:Mrp family chromosome partitioning ATPase